MSTNFPTSLDSLTNPTATDTVAGVDHAAQHSNVNDAIEAMQAKLGVDSSAVTTSIDYKLKNPASIDPGHKHTTSSLSVSGLTANQLLRVNSGGTAIESSGKVAPSGAIVGDTDTQTLTNKTIDGDNNTVQDLPANTVFKSGTAVPIANGGTGQTTKTEAFDALAPSTTKGDITVFNGSDNVRLPVGSDNQILIADSAQSTGVKWGSPNSTGCAKIVVDPTAITVGNTTTETTLFSVSVSGGVLSTNNAIRVVVYLSNFACNSSGSITFRLKYGGTTIATLVMATTGATTSNIALNGVMMTGFVVANGGTSSQKGTLMFIGGDGTLEDDNLANVDGEKGLGGGNGTASVDSTTSQTLSITAQWTAAAVANTLTAEAWVVEKIA